MKWHIDCRHKRLGFLFIIFLFAIQFATPIDSLAQSSNLTIGNYVKVSEKRISRTVYEYTFQADITNNGPLAINVIGTVTSNFQYTTIVDNKLTFGNVPAGATVSSSDTFTFRHDRQYPFSWANFLWEINSQGTPPTLSNVRLSPSSLPVPRQGEQFFQSLVFDFADPNADISHFNLTFTYPDGTTRSIMNEFRRSTTSGTYQDSFLIDSLYGAGLYLIEIELIDDQGNSSGIQTVSFTINSATEPFFEITAIEPSTGKPGDKITLRGIGFDQEFAKNFVFFNGVLFPAQVISGTSESLDVLVPEGSLSGYLTVKNSLGSVPSLETFLVDKTISLSPEISNLVVGSSVNFTCKISGMAQREIQWTLNGSTTPDPAYGTINQTGQYTAPATVPGLATVTVRCSSVSDPSLYKESQFMLIAPVAGDEGTLEISPDRGGFIREKNGFVSVEVPPEALQTKTPISIRYVNPSRITSTTDTINLVAATFEPSGIHFEKPVKVTFALPDYEPPGSLLPLYVVESTGTVMPTGQSAVVDASGLKAEVQIIHFSTYVLRKFVAPESKAQSASQFELQSNLFWEFVIATSDDIPMLEGLSVPVVVRRTQGPGSGWGPFSTGTNAVPVLSGYDINNTPLSVGPVIHPSPDGWELGTVINIPTLRNCGEGQTKNATLVMWYGDSSATMSVPFTIQCLNELEMSGTPYVLPSPVPPGASLFEDKANGSVVLKILPGQKLRFSEVNIGKGASLLNGLGTIEEVTHDYLGIEVTGNMTISGNLITKGSAGSKGKDGSGADNGGAGGYGGVWHGGAGGKGGPASPAEKRGRDAVYGGQGGDRGLKWEKGSWIKFVFDAAETIYYAGSFVASEGSDLSSLYYAIESAYEAKDEAVKIYNNKENQLYSAGGGGYSASSTLYPDFGVGRFIVPLAGGGGGGSGKMVVSLQPDAAGAGGGGGGGGAPTLRIFVRGSLVVNPGGLIDGRGGDGGQGGNGAGSWYSNQAAPGGGGAGGNGALIQIMALKGIFNNGTIIAQGGVGGLSGELNGDGEVVLVDTGCGQPGHDGGLRLDAQLSGNNPERFRFLYYGPMFDGTPEVSYSNEYCLNINFNDATYKYFNTPAKFAKVLNGTNQQTSFTVIQPVCFRLSEGLNLLSVKANYENENNYVGLHPWQSKPVFLFPKPADSDNDGLWDRDEIRLGTSLTNPDSDGDGLTDGAEVHSYHTNPLKADSDGDGLSDAGNSTRIKDASSRGLG
jgi:hypothetical protein